MTSVESTQAVHLCSSKVGRVRCAADSSSIDTVNNSVSLFDFKKFDKIEWKSSCAPQFEARTTVLNARFIPKCAASPGKDCVIDGAVHVLVTANSTFEGSGTPRNHENSVCQSRDTVVHLWISLPPQMEKWFRQHLLQSICNPLQLCFSWMCKCHKMNAAKRVLLGDSWALVYWCCRVPRQSFVANSVEMHRDSLVLRDFVHPKMETKNTWCVFFVKLTSMYGMGQSGEWRLNWLNRMVEYHLYPVPRLFALQGHGFTSSPGPTWEERVPTSGSLDHVRIMWRKGLRKWASHGSASQYAIRGPSRWSPCWIKWAALCHAGQPRCLQFDFQGYCPLDWEFRWRLEAVQLRRKRLVHLKPGPRSKVEALFFHVSTRSCVEAQTHDDFISYW